MLNNGYLSSDINPNSLAVDKELTQKFRNISNRFKQRMGNVQRKVNELGCYSRDVTLRVDCAASRMASLKNHKPVKQIVSTENVLRTEDLQENRKKFDMYSPTFLEGYRNAIIGCGRGFDSLDNFTVFPPNNQYESSAEPSAETNGYSHENGHNGYETNGYKTNGRHSAAEFSLSDESEYQENNSAYLARQTIVDEEAASDEEEDYIPRTSDTSSNDTKQHSPLSQSSQKEESVIETTRGLPDIQLDQSLVENVAGEDIPPKEPSPVSKVNVLMRNPAMASVIGEMRQRNTANANKFFDSDSDSDAEPDKVAAENDSNVKVEAPNAKPVESVPETKSKPVVPIQPKIERKVPVFAPKETKPKAVASKLFDSDSDSDSGSCEPLFKGPVTTQPLPTPGSTPYPVSSTAVKTNKSSSEKASDAKIETKPPIVTSQPDLIPDNVPNQKSSVKTSSSEVAAPKLASAETKTVITTQPGPTPGSKPHPTTSTSVNNTKPSTDVPPSSSTKTKPVVVKSLFSSDSDSDDDFLKSFAKPNAKPVTAPVSTSIGSKSVPKEQAVKKAEDVIIPKKGVDPIVPKATIPPATVTTKTTIPVETAKKPTTSLFDDSDSDSDLFSTKKKEPKPVVAAAPKQATPIEPQMEPLSSEQTKPVVTAAPKKMATSEAMSAKISLIAEMQKSFRLPGTAPIIPAKSSSEVSPQETPQEEEDTVGTILKSRCRGPSNRRPPTRVSKNK